MPVSRSLLSCLAGGAIFLAFGPVGPAYAEPLHGFSAPTLSPDGSVLASLHTVEHAGADTPSPPELVLRDLRSGQSITIAPPCTGCVLSSPSWSPDGQTLAYISAIPKTRKRQVLAVSRDGRAAHVLLRFTGSLQALRYGPQGQLAVLAIANARRDPGALQAGAPQTGEIDRTEDEQRIALIEQGHLTWQSPASLYVYEYDWQKGDRPAFIGTVAQGNGDAHWWEAHLSRFSEGRETILYTHGLTRQIGLPAVSPDGTRVAFIAGLMSDFGFFGGDAFQLDLTRSGAEPVNLTKDRTDTVTGLTWCDGRLVASGLSGARTVMRALDRGPTLSVSSDDLLSDGSGEPRLVCAAGQSVVVRQNFVRAPELWAGPIGHWKQITRLNSSVPLAVDARSVTWSSDGLTVQGWHLSPKHRAPAMMRDGKAPMITIVHGGPSSAVTPRYLRETGDARGFLEAGYDLFMPNPRGSYGQGEAFTMANRRDFGHGDLRDILRGIDTLEKTALIDDTRLAVTGYSYGGYMTMWIVTQTDRFKAAAAGGGVANWQSYYGQNGIDAWMPPFFGATVYDDPEIYARSSPMTFIKKVRTPTFLYVGANDVECPPAQSLEFYHALRTLSIPSRLVIYPGEGHGMRGTAHAADARRRILDWFDRYLNQPRSGNGAP
ncbi:S9 family peptidase [Swaminathania salitolerans]|uniref:Peptidase S9 prolyl oligopeptidase catalytic domain-containing protein n=1 Tax=Swaminathania salitolerans TaxID=182838 RepID=A0A511BUB1_9PROT|nr:S9 family peptidase [Swaminathania salitolerans]GBQ13160.1 putative peptidase [Swaminathania salitolerans LMG 21291]GEL03353.1 hypothetical protein SSA02_25160 [Swaminathania salitolerans]